MRRVATNGRSMQRQRICELHILLNLTRPLQGTFPLIVLQLPRPWPSSSEGPVLLRDERALERDSALPVSCFGPYSSRSGGEICLNTRMGYTSGAPRCFYPHTHKQRLPAQRPDVPCSSGTKTIHTPHIQEGQGRALDDRVRVCDSR